MLHAKIVGTLVSTIKHRSLRSRKLLIVQPMMADGVTHDGDPLVAVDAVGAGKGQCVTLSSDGRYAREWLNVDATPVRWTVIAVDDD